MSTTEPLLPCPFCGGEAELLEGAPGLYSAENHLYHAKCQSCGASAYDHGRDGAIAAWNRRTPPAAVPDGLMDALKSAEKALRPFFNAVFNDNGDMTVSSGYPYHEAIAGYHAYKRVRAMISASPTPPVDDGWRPIETAPKDGTRFWGKIGDDAIAMLWHPKFNAFVSAWRRMTMVKGYMIDGDASLDHSPIIEHPEAWMPLPAPPKVKEE